MSKGPAALVALVALAGCLASPQGGAGRVVGGPPGDASVQPFDVAADLEACEEAFAILYADTARVQRLLPAGFTANEGRPFGGAVEAPTGKVTVYAVTWDCGRSAVEGGSFRFAMVGADILPPRTEAIEERETHHVYNFATDTSGPGHLALLRSAGAALHVGEVAASVAATPASSASQGSAADEDGEAFAVALAGGGRVATGVTTRIWEVTEHGLMVIDWEQADEPLVTIDLGALTACNVRAGTVLHDLLGTTDCMPFPSQGGASAAWRTSARWRFVPGATIQEAPPGAFDTGSEDAPRVAREVAP